MERKPCAAEKWECHRRARILARNNRGACKGDAFHTFSVSLRAAPFSRGCESIPQIKHQRNLPPRRPQTIPGVSLGRSLQVCISYAGSAVSFPAVPFIKRSESDVPPRLFLPNERLSLVQADRGEAFPVTRGPRRGRRQPEKEEEAVQSRLETQQHAGQGLLILLCGKAMKEAALCFLIYSFVALDF